MDPLIFFIFTSEDVYPFVFDRHSKMPGCVPEIHLKKGYFELLLFQLYVKTTSCSIWCLFVCNHHYLSIICRTNASYIDVNAPDFCDITTATNLVHVRETLIHIRFSLVKQKGQRGRSFFSVFATDRETGNTELKRTFA